MTTATPNTVRVTANIPGYVGPFVMDVPTLDPNSEATVAKACRRALFSLMSAGHYDPEGTPDEALTLFTGEYLGASHD